MKLTIHQPEHMPWLGFFHKISLADVYVALDNVQYRHKYFQNRNKIRDVSGEVWLNLPVLKKDLRTLIKDVRIDNNSSRWREKNWKRIYYSYKNAPHFKEYESYFENLYQGQWDRLSDFNLDVIKNCMKFLGIETNIILSSELGIEGEGEQLILDICKEFKPEVYISGPTGIAGRGKEYEKHFIDEGVPVIYHDFTHPVYKQL